MTTSLLIIAVGLSAGQYPDALDHLRSGDIEPQVGLLLDRSCSMGWGDMNTDCNWYASTYKGGNTWLDKKDQMKAVLVGCRSATDGILDLWQDKVNFSIYEFGSSVKRTTKFESTLTEHELGVLGIPASGSTYMTRGIKDHGKYFRDYFKDSNTLSCRPNFLVMLSDGNPNGGGSTFNYECSAPVESRYVSSYQPWEGSDYLNDHEDILCDVEGDQNIRTYTIGFGAPGDFSPSNLQNIANRGGGEYFYASDVIQLSGAFENIIGSIVSKSALFFAPIAIQTGSMFSENYAYAATFRPAAGGPWRGTVKKYCVSPPVLANGKYDTSVDTCLFSSEASGEYLETNPDAVDLWTGSQSLAADKGGAGAVLYPRLGTTPGGPPATPYWTRRNIITYRPGASDFTSVTPSNWNSLDAWANGCERYRLINYLHGYTYDADCSTGAPVAASAWALGDPIGFAPILLKYAECETNAGVPVPGVCYLVSANNDGMVHFYDAATGDETTALIPSELWQPNPYAHNRLGEILDQPNGQTSHRYYVDGAARLFHEDNNADGLIQSSEKALLAFSLGRGGRTSYLIPVSELPGGVLTATKNPVYPLRPQVGTALEDMQDMWAPPWLGIAPINGANKRVAVFASGHVPTLDLTVADVLAGVVPRVSGTIDTSLAQPANCNGAGHFSDFNGLGASSVNLCDQYYLPSCDGTSGDPCYDGAGTPLDVSTAPLTYNDGLNVAAAIRIYFGKFDLSPSDELRIEDTAGNLIGSYSGSDLDGDWTPWVYDSSIVIRLITDGVDTPNAGYKINSIEWVSGPALAVAIGTLPVGADPGASADILTLGVDHNPSIYIMDLDKWNSSTPQPFANLISDDGMLLRFTNDCGLTGGPRCVDQTDILDLQHMKCPISAEVSVYTEEDRLQTIYVGDECAQIWKFWTEDVGVTWKARRLINLNSGDIDVDKDHRKIFRKIDIVLSACQGRRSVGLYFGTGDVQRPSATNQLEDPAFTDGYDLMGVLFDAPDLPVDLTQADIEDTTALGAVSPSALLASGKYGWAIRLVDNERMLRDALVFDKVGYFKTFEPTTAALECGAGSGVDRIYALNSCTSAAAQDVNGDGTRTISERDVWQGATEVGGGLFFYTPKDRPVLVSHADISTRQRAGLNEGQRTRPGIFFWREK